MAAKRKPAKKWSELSPAYRARLERAYKSGTFGSGYKSAGRAYAAGAPRQVARGQAKTSEADRSRARARIKRAREWSRKHSRDPLTQYDPPAGLPLVEQGELADKYYRAMKELEKGWKRGPESRRQRVEWDTVREYWAEVEFDFTDFDDYFGNF